MAKNQDRMNQLRFLHLFERVGEPMYFSPRGEGNSMMMYTVEASSIPCAEVADASRRTQSSFTGMTTVQVSRPSQMPNLTNVAKLCPRSDLYNYFNPQHRNATRELRDVFMRQDTLDNLFAMCCACRDSPSVNCKLWINAFAGCMLTHKATRDRFRVPAAWEVMPDVFFNSFTMRQAFRQAELPTNDRAIITVENPVTGRNSNPENRLAYFREDIGINSHHWHWHLVYRIEDRQLQGRRKGELFYFMHHSMIARYDAERLGLGMQRVRPLMIEDRPMVKHGYFGKLNDSNSGQNWGTRQADTPLVNMNRADDQALPVTFRTVTLEQLRKWRDRVFEAIDTGTYLARGNERRNLDIDVLGDIVEGSDLNPNPQLYGPDGIHNVGHVLIAYSHDPEHKHLENGGPMSDTTTAMRDPAFYQWHKYIDILFDAYKMTQQPYQDRGGDFPLAWTNIQVTNISVQHATFGSTANLLRTFLMRSHVDLSRGLDFLRRDMNQLGPIWLRFAHLNHEPFNYTITVRNGTSGNVRATVRIYMAPRLNEHGERFVMAQQRKLFFEMDKFVQELRPGENTITRNSLVSDVTVPWEQTFRDLERGVETPTAQQSICGCGWPQHMLLPKGTQAGQVFDLVVFLTNAAEDDVQGATRNPQGNCRESLSFCGRLDQPYPDRKPMGYPWDRNVFSIPDPNNAQGPQRPVENLDEYVSRIPNMRAIQIRIVHEATPVRERPNDGPTTAMREVSGDPSSRSNPMCPDQGQRGGARPSSMTSTSSSSGGGGRPRPSPMETGGSPPRTRPTSTSPQPSGSSTRPQVWGGRPQQPSGGRQTWGSGSGGGRQYDWGGGGGSGGHTHQYHRPGSPQSPQSPQGWTRVSTSRPGSPNWGWGG